MKKFLYLSILGLLLASLLLPSCGSGSAKIRIATDATWPPMEMVDKNKKIRKSHQNKSALKIYEDYLGEIGGEKAHKLLHTKYHQRDYV